jgi:carbon storage regulator
MLVLSRKKDESIVITLGLQTVEIRVLKTEGNKVRLGIEAPEDIAIHRDEVWRRRAEFAADRPALVPAHQ